MNTRSQQLIQRIAMASVAAILALVCPANAQGEYIAEDLFTIPWGDEPGCLSTDWNIPPDSPDWRGLTDAPGPWAVSSEGEFVIVGGGRLMKFSPDGTLTAYIDLPLHGLGRPFALAINSSGQVLLENHEWDPTFRGYITTLCLFDSSLQPLNEASIPSGKHTMVWGIYPSDTGSFWIIYCTSNQLRSWHERHLIEYSPDGSISSPQLLYAGKDSDPGPLQTRFVTPSGEPRSQIEDVYGYAYKALGEEPTVGRFSPDGELVCTFDYSSDPGWVRFRGGSPRWHVTWAGDVFILHATEEGAVLTKYTLVVE